MIVKTDEKNYQDIADAIRSKLGTDATYLPSEMAGAIEGIKSGEGFDFQKMGFSKEYSDATNDLLRTNITAELNKFKENENNNDWSELFRYSEWLFIIPPIPVGVTRLYRTFMEGNFIDVSNVDFTNMNYFSYCFANCEKIQKIPTELNVMNVYPNLSHGIAIFTGCVFDYPLDFVFNIGNKEVYSGAYDLQQMFRGTTFNAECSIKINGDRPSKNFMTFFQQAKFNVPLRFFEFIGSQDVTSIAFPNSTVKAKKIKFGDLSKCTSFGITLSAECEEFELDNWKQGDINLSVLNLLSPQSIRYDLDNAMTIEEGAINRTLILNATANANFIASFEGEDAYNAYIEEIALTKDITIA